MNQSLLNSIANADYTIYSGWCADDMSCMEPESNQNLVIGKKFHKYYFDLYGTVDEKMETKTNVTMVQPHVQWIGGSESPTGAVISYVKVTQQCLEGQAPTTIQQSETRVWEKRGDDWKNIHFHKSPYVKQG